MVEIVKVDLKSSDGSYHDVTGICRPIFDPTTNLALRSREWPRGLEAFTPDLCELTYGYQAFGTYYECSTVIRDGLAAEDAYLDSHYRDALSTKVTSPSSDLRTAYSNARPFPSLVIDGLFNEKILEQVVAVFPKMEDMGG